jgi:hypothetical protein
MEDKIKNTISLIDSYLTPNYVNKLQNKRYNLKKHLYRRRLAYGRFEQTGIVNEALRTLPWIYQSENQKELLANININKEFAQNNDESEIYLNCLLNNSDFNFNFRPSKRELRLKAMLSEKIQKLMNNNLTNN